jgi:hypothetical protein
MARNTVAVTHCCRMQGRTPDATPERVPQGDPLLCVPAVVVCDSRNIEESVMSGQLREIKDLIERLEYENMAYFRGMGAPGLAIAHAINKLTEVYTSLGGDRTKA